jgi:hypothetical protein
LLLRVEQLTFRKALGVCIAVLGVVAALAAGLSAAPPGAWRGELIMAAAVFCMAFYNVLSWPSPSRPISWLASSRSLPASGSQRRIKKAWRPKSRKPKISGSDNAVSAARYAAAIASISIRNCGP